jgi:protein SCO1/2
MRPALAAIAVVAVGTAALWRGTDGGRAFTSEGARRLAVARQPRIIPPVRLQDQDGRAFTLAELGGRPVAVDFIFTRCTTLCPALGRTFAAVQRELPSSGTGAAAATPVLVSISIDPARDTPERLMEYARMHGADPRRWRVARPLSDADRTALLAAFGIRVIPDGAGGFVHNGAVHLLDARGRLVTIVDYDNPHAIAERVTAGS